MTYSVLEYLYRDAGNNKAWGDVLLKGVFTADEVALLRSYLEGQEYFNPDEIGIPSLQTELWRLCNTHYSDGLDHAWHELVDVRPATLEDQSNLKLWGSTRGLLENLQAAHTKNRRI